METLRRRARTSSSDRNVGIISKSGFSVTIILVLSLVHFGTTLSSIPSSDDPMVTNTDGIGEELGATLEPLTTTASSGEEIINTSGFSVEPTATGIFVEPTPTFQVDASTSQSEPPTSIQPSSTGPYIEPSPSVSDTEVIVSTESASTAGPESSSQAILPSSTQSVVASSSVTTPVVTEASTPVYCSIDTCLHGGTCRNDTVNERYNCTCTSAWTGDVCGENVNECQDVTLNNCNSTANCSDTDGGFTCACWSGYTGDGISCENVDECNDPKFETNCHTYATCKDIEGSFQCACKPGFLGDGITCEDINECEPDPCNAHGYCANLVAEYKCLCNGGWTGVNCSTAIDFCAPKDPCQNGGRCTSQQTDYECNCTGTNVGVGIQDFEGKECEREIVLFGNDDNLLSVVGRTSDDGVYGPYRFPAGFPYGNVLHDSVYVSMNGYAVLDQAFSASARPASTDRKVFVAPFWTDLDSRAKNQDSVNYLGSLTLKMYHQSTDRDSEYLNTLGKIVQNKSSTDNVTITSAFVATWFNVAPFPADSYLEVKDDVAQLSQRIKFQLILATDGKQSFAVFNYDLWGLKWDFTDTSRTPASIGYTADDGSFQGVQDNVKTLSEVIHSSNVGKNGRWVFMVGGVAENPRSDCLTWYYKPDNNLKQKMQTAGSSAPACPCTAAQARDDLRFYFYEAENKAESVMWKANMKAMCKYDQVTGALIVGYPGGGYVLVKDDVDTAGQLLGDDLCCNDTRMCDLFYARQISTDCVNYKAPSLSLSWGKPHFLTLFDDYDYTFNGLGEFVLIQSPNISLQCRTSQVIPSAQATFFTGYAVKAADTEKLQFLYAGGQSIDIYLNGTKIASADSTAITPDAVIENTVIRIHNGRLTIMFSSGLNLQMVAYDTGYLMLVVAATPEMITSPDGLLSASMDTGATLRNGTQIDITENIKEEELFEFAKSWALIKDESLFTYDATKTFSDYSNEGNKFTPVFYSDLLKANASLVDAMPQAIQDQCDGDHSCLVDYLATGNSIIAETSHDNKEEVDNENANLGNHAPVISPAMPSIINITVGVQLQLLVQSTDEDPVDTLVTRLDTRVTLPGVFSIEDATIQWTLDTTVRGWTEGLKVLVSDLQNATDIYHPELHICACDDANACVWENINDVGTDANPGLVYFASCNCARSKTGRWCETDVDLCSVASNPCYPGVSCTVDNDEVVCGPCPGGMTTFGKKCIHVNHCQTDSSNCEQKCDYIDDTSTYNCSCEDNYKLLNSTHCTDIDECLEGKQICDPSEYCHNIAGGAECLCLPGYSRYIGNCRRDSDVKQFSGSLTCQRVDSLPWSEELRNEQSENYGRVVKALEESLGEIFNSTHTKYGFLDGRITELSNGSIVANYDLFMSRDVTQADLDRAMNAAFGGCTQDCGLDGNKILGINPDQALAPRAKEFCTADLNPCSTDSTVCNSTDGNWRCDCKPGFNPVPFSNTMCRDTDECLSNPCGTAQCENTVGSYRCFCADQFVYSDAGKECLGVCEVTPCKNGATCTPAGRSGYACQCADDWKGPTCEEENTNSAKDWKTKLIIVGSVLGALCFIFIVALLICFFRSRGSRYQADIKGEGATGSWEGKIPRAQIRKLQVYDSVEMEEKTDDRHYASLHDDSSHKYDEPNRSLTRLNDKTLSSSGADNPGYANSPTSDETYNSRF